MGMESGSNPLSSSKTTVFGLWFSFLRLLALRRFLSFAVKYLPALVESENYP